MVTPQEKFQLLTKLIQTKIPGFQNKTKDQSLLLKIVGPVVSLFNKDFYNSYITTLGKTTYWSNMEQMNTDWAWNTLAHEYVHLYDHKKNPALFYLKYLFPQVLAIFALGAFGAIWSLWCLLFLVFLLALLPIPSPGRTELEMRGYTMTMAVEELWYTKNAPSQFLIDWISPQFTTMAYYGMCPNKLYVETMLKTNASMILDGSILTPEENEPFRDIYKFLKDLGEI
jgi:hypothetical protein